MTAKCYDLKHTADLIADRVRLFPRDSTNAVTQERLCLRAIQHFGQTWHLFMERSRAPLLE